jgi:uncharacterized protein (DUF1778 family)
MITRKPKKAPKPHHSSKEVKAKKFIKSAGAESTNGNGRLQPVMMKIDRTVLALIDAKAESLGLSRTAYMVVSATMKAEELESEAAQSRFILAAHKAKADAK